MTAYDLKITEEEARNVMSGDKMFVFRSSQYQYYIGDTIRFHVVKNGHDKANAIDKAEFVVTYADREAPVEQGYTVIGFRRIK